MHASTLQGVLEHLRKLTDPARIRELSDADLLERFRLGREEAAFTLLVQRHGPMVLAVCRRVLGDAHEAEDAFQATFLVLVRKAATIRMEASLSSWLHVVATHLAHKARAQSARRRAGEREAVLPAQNDDSFETLAARELRAALDEEIARLPAKYRTPLVLCYLADKTHEQAAKELGWPKSSVTARLAKARQLLQQRLIRRGFTVPAGLLAVLLTEQSLNATGPSLLTLSTVRLAVQALTGETLAATTVAVLAGTFAGRAVVSKWTAALLLLATLGLASTIGYRMAGSGSPSKQPESAPRPQTEGEPKTAKDEPRKPRVDRLGDTLPDEVLARIGSGRMRHGGYVRTLSFTPDGKSIVSGGVGSLCIWDAVTGKQRQRFQLNSDWNLAFAFTAAGIAVASADKAGIVTVQLFDRASGKVGRRVEMKERATSATFSFSADGKRIAFTQGNTVRLCDAATGKEILRIPTGRRPASDMAFAPDGKTIALSNFTYIIPLHDTTTGKCVRELKRYVDNIFNIFFFSAVFSPDGRLLASISNPIRREEEAGEISIWDVKTGMMRQRLKAPFRWLLCAAFSPDSRYLAMGGNRPEVVLWEVATGKEVRRYPSESPVGSIAFSPDGKRLAAASTNGAIRLWDVATGRILPASADQFLEASPDLRFSADGRRLLGRDTAFISWNPHTGQEIRRLAKTPDDRPPLALSPDESLLVRGGQKGTLHLEDAATGRSVRDLKVAEQEKEEEIREAFFSPDGRRLVSCGFAGTVRVWDVASGRQLHSFANDRWSALAISPQGRWLASAVRGNGRSEVLFWDLNAGREKPGFALTGDIFVNQMAFSPDSRLLAIAASKGNVAPGEVSVWDVTSGQRWRLLDSPNKSVLRVAFSSDGRMLASGHADGMLFLWELASGRRRHSFLGHETGISSLAFSPDRRLLAASSFEAPIYVWDVAGSRASGTRRLSNNELRRCWTALAGKDAPAAFQAIHRLAAAPKQTLPFLREHLKPVPAPDRQRVRQLVDMLDSADFPTREKANAELEKQADAAAALLRQILTKEKPSLEVRRRLQQILEAQEHSPEALRAVRAVEVLEWLVTPEAVRLIDELANGTADARLTREASAARQRRRR